MLLKRLEIPRGPWGPSFKSLQGVFLKELDDQVLCVRVKIIREGIFYVDDLLEGLPFLARLEGEVPADHLIDDHTEGPEVRTWRRNTLLEHFRAHEERGAAKLPFLRNHVRYILVH
jgi:hypothetical protein